MSKDTILVKLPSRDRVEFIPSTNNPRNLHVVVCMEDKHQVFAIAAGEELDDVELVKVISKALPIAFPNESSVYCDDPKNYLPIEPDHVVSEKDIGEITDIMTGKYYYTEDGFKAVPTADDEEAFYLEWNGEPVFVDGKRPGQLKKVGPIPEEVKAAGEEKNYRGDLPTGELHSFFDKLVKEKEKNGSFKIYEQREDSKNFVAAFDKDGEYIPQDHNKDKEPAESWIAYLKEWVR